MSGRAAELVPLARDVAAELSVADCLSCVGQSSGMATVGLSAPRKPEVHQILDHGDRHSLGPPGIRGLRRGAGASAGGATGGRATKTTGLGFGAGLGFARGRMTGRSGFGFGSGSGNARFIRANVFLAHRWSLGVPAANTGPAAAGCSSRR
jgi:hypothetical protein